MQFNDLAAQYQALKLQMDAALYSVLKDGQFIMGPEVSVLEEELSLFFESPHIITCANGTDALQMLYMAYEIGTGDAVFCPDITFIASIEPACMLGATPVFCDVEPASFQICPKSLERQIQAVQREGKLTPRAIVVVDFLGYPADLDEIDAIAKKYDLFLIEDAAQAAGALYKGKPCGCFGDSAITSFFPAKPLGCYGDGGAIMTHDEKIAALCRSFRVHGKGKSKYDNVRIGLNSRLDTLQAAVLLEKLKAFKEKEIDARQAIAAKYEKAFQEKLQLLQVMEGCRSIYAQFAILAHDTQERERIIARLSSQQIPSLVYYPAPMHALPVFQGLSRYGESFDVATDYCARTLSLPMHAYLYEESQQKVIDAVLSEF